MQSHDNSDGPTVPKDTTPTWEMELLVSGGTVFGLIQLSGLVDDSFASIYNRAGDDLSYSLMPLWVYVKFVMITLIGAFILHLCLRGYWVALVGMDSVYPGGVNWDKLRLGPQSRRHVEKNAKPTPVAIAIADNRATRVFGMGFGFAMMMMVPIALAFVSMLLSFALRKVFGLTETKWLFAAVLLLLLVPWATTAFMDQQWGHRIREGGLLQRLLHANFRFYDRLGFGRNSNLLLSTFISRVGTRQWAWASLLIMGLVFTVVIAQFSLAAGRLEFGEFPGLPDNGPFATDSVSPAFYASQGRNTPELLPLPYIPDRVARGPYLEVFVPYLPRKHALAMQDACPAALAASEKGESRDSLDCLARLLDPQLDGKPLPLQLDASSDPRSGLPGLLAMVPIRDLAPGRHELSLAAVDPRRQTRGQPTRRYRIPFWK